MIRFEAMAVACLLATAALSVQANDERLDQKRILLVKAVKSANLGAGCMMNLLVPQHSTRLDTADLSVGGASFQLLDVPNPGDEWNMYFWCAPADEGQVIEGWARRDTGSGEWQLNMDAEELARLDATASISIYQVTSRNATGWAVRIDDITGDEIKRRRLLVYCILKNAHAVCGESVVGSIERISRKSATDRTPFALHILRSIEFLDDAPPDDSVKQQP